MNPQTWRLEGVDTFDGYETYPINGTYDTARDAYRAARDRLTELDGSQSPGSSGGQAGIQDQVYVIHPDGRRERIWP